MDIRTQFPTRFITAADLNGKSFTLTIKAVTLEEMQTHDNQKTIKPCLWFDGAQRGMVLNKTNSMIIADLYTYETDSWVGKRITIQAERVKAFGSWQEAIRVREEVPAPAKPAPASAPVAGDAADLDDLDEVTDVDENGADASIWDTGSPSAKSPDDITPAQLLRLTKLMAHVYGTDWGRYEATCAGEASKGAVGRFSDLKVSEAQALIGKLEAAPKVDQIQNGKVAVS
jgi:hypothetical protein